MKVLCEIRLVDFKFWCGAKSRAEQLSYDELEQLEYILQDIYPEGVEDTTINDLFWFDFPIVCDWLGLKLNENEDVIRE